MYSIFKKAVRVFISIISKRLFVQLIVELRKGCSCIQSYNLENDVCVFVKKAVPKSYNHHMVFVCISYVLSIESSYMSYYREAEEFCCRENEEFSKAYPRKGRPHTKSSLEQMRKHGGAKGS